MGIVRRRQCAHELRLGELSRVSRVRGAESVAEHVFDVGDVFFVFFECGGVWGCSMSICVDDSKQNKFNE